MSLLQSLHAVPEGRDMRRPKPLRERLSDALSHEVDRLAHFLTRKRRVRLERRVAPLLSLRHRAAIVHDRAREARDREVVVLPNLDVRVHLRARVGLAQAVEAEERVATAVVRLNHVPLVREILVLSFQLVPRVLHVVEREGFEVIVVTPLLGRKHASVA